MSTLLFYNFKGGVGKTTISVLAADRRGYAPSP